MFLVFRFLRFLCKFVILRPRGSDEEVVLSSFFCIYSHSITMTKIENRDFALIFSGKRPFNTLSKINLSDIVIVTMNFYLYSAQDMLIWNSQCRIFVWRKACSTKASLVFWEWSLSWNPILLCNKTTPDFWICPPPFNSLNTLSPCTLCIKTTRRLSNPSVTPRQPYHTISIYI